MSKGRTWRRWLPPGGLLALLAGGPPALAAQPAPNATPEAPLGPPAPAPEAPPPDPPRLLEAEKKLAQEEQDLAALRRELAAERQARLEHERMQEEQAGVAARKAEALEAATPVAGARRGLSLGGFVHNDLGLSRQSSEDELSPATGDPLNENRFLIRRARLRIAFEHGVGAGALELDANTVRGPVARPIGAEASLRWPPAGAGGSDLPLVMGTVGLFKIPFGFEVVQSDKERVFLERSNAARALFPGEYDLGARVQGGWRFLRYALAVQNGEPMGERTLPGRDPNAAKDVVARVGIDTEVVSGVAIAAGVSGLKGRGFSKGTPGTKDVLEWRDANEDGQVQLTELHVIPGAAPVASSSFDRFGLGGDLRVTFQVPGVGTAVAGGELYVANNLDRGYLPADPVARGRDLRELGFVAQVTQEIGPRWLAGVRYDSYDPDRDASDTRLGAPVPVSRVVSTLALVAGARASWGRLLLEWDRNRNNLGRTTSGAPTNLKDDALTLRGELVF